LLGDREYFQVRVEVLSDQVRQVYPGYETEPRGQETVRKRMELLSKQNLEEGARRLDVLVSTTGWDATAVALAQGEKGGETRCATRWTVALVDLENDALICSPACTGLQPILDLFRPSVRIGLASEIVDFIKSNLVGPEFLTEAAVVDRFQAPVKMVRAVFQSLADSGEYETREMKGTGLTLTRKYDS